MSRYYCQKYDKEVVNLKAEKVCLINGCPHLKTKAKYLKRGRRRNDK